MIKGYTIIFTKESPLPLTTVFIETNVQWKAIEKLKTLFKQKLTDISFLENGYIELDKKKYECKIIPVQHKV